MRLVCPAQNVVRGGVVQIGKPNENIRRQIAIALLIAAILALGQLEHGGKRSLRQVVVFP